MLLPTTAKTVRAGVIGTGHFATAIVTQSQSIPALDVPVVCDLNLDAARRAYDLAGVTDYTVCENRAALLAALDRGQHAIIADAALMMNTPIDIVVESTGLPEVAARHARLAIENGKHVAMVGKEADVVVGPILKQRADRAGLVYTAIDGDQHGLLIALVRWARQLGLEVIGGGKALDAEVVYDDGVIDWHGQTIPVAPADRSLFEPGPTGIERALRRQPIVGQTAQAFDIVEMVIAMNATGLPPDIRGAVLRIPEIPAVVTQGMDAVACLRGPYEAGLGGGVFVVVLADTDYSRHILATKGCITAGDAALVYRPYHLCGVETPMSLLVAGLLNQPTGATEYLPRYDVLVQAAAGLKAGDTVGDDHDPALAALVRPAVAVGGSAPVPFHMANGNRLAVDVPAGTVLTADMIEVPAESALWALRREQDRAML
jgi:predicted homoserine dehydrogenase-like protein